MGCVCWVFHGDITMPDSILVSFTTVLCSVDIQSKFSHVRFHLYWNVEFVCYVSGLSCITSWVMSWSEIWHERTTTWCYEQDMIWLVGKAYSSRQAYLLPLPRFMYRHSLAWSWGTVCICWTVQSSRSWASRLLVTCLPYLLTKEPSVSPASHAGNLSPTEIKSHGTPDFIFINCTKQKWFHSKLSYQLSNPSWYPAGRQK